MSITVNTKVYTADAATSANSIPYIGPASTLSTKDRIDVYRTHPKGNAVYSGNGRSRVKMTRTLPLTGAKTTSSDAIVDIHVSIPVGAAAADVDTLHTDASAAFAQAWAKALAKNLTINI
jgi:hypothetical protein